MRAYVNTSYWARLVLLLLFMSPLVVLFLLPSGSYAGLVWFWLLGLLLIVLLYLSIGPPRNEDEPQFEAGAAAAAEDPTPESVNRVLEVEESATAPAGIRVFRGRLREPGEPAYAELKQGMPSDVVPMMLEDRGGRTTIALLPRRVEKSTLERPIRPWVHWLLFAATILTTTFAGAAHQGVNLIRQPEQFAVGLPYALGLLAILGCHELGHYFTARHHGMLVTPPYFIPVPFALGTFGAFIQMRTPPENRRALFDVAVAGPLAGLVIAIPALYFGLQTSEIVPSAGTNERFTGLGGRASILMALVINAARGDVATGSAVQLSPLAFAGWLGLLVTALNLLPIGQLDGGHIARSMFGTRTGIAISWIAMMSLFALALFVWPGLLMWAIIVFFIAGRGTPPLNDVTRLSTGRKLLGAFAFIILAVILIPMPEALPELGSLRCPYL